MGRPRSTQAHDHVIEAAHTLFADRGIDATSMDAIAALSGVSKATIYKHWPDKDALCFEVMSHLHGCDADRPEPDTGTLRGDLLAVLSIEPPAAHAEVRARIMPHLMAHAARNPAFAVAWRARVFEPPRRQLARALARGMERGELPTSVDIEVALAMLLGPVFYGHVRKVTTGEAPADLRVHVVEGFLRSQGATGVDTDAGSQPVEPRRRQSSAARRARAARRRTVTRR